MNPDSVPPPRSYRASHKVLGKPMHGLGLSCRHFAELVVESLDRELTRREAMRYRIHASLCAICRGFRDQMQALRVLVRHAVPEQAVPPLDPDFLASTRAKLEAAAAESPDPSS